MWWRILAVAWPIGYTYTHTRTHTHTHTHTHCMCVCVCACVCIHTHFYTTCVCVCVYTPNMCVCVCVLYTHPHHTHTHTQVLKELGATHPACSLLFASSFLSPPPIFAIPRRQTLATLTAHINDTSAQLRRCVCVDVCV